MAAGRIESASSSTYMVDSVNPYRVESGDWCEWEINQYYQLTLEDPKLVEHYLFNLFPNFKSSSISRKIFADLLVLKVNFIIAIYMHSDAAPSKMPQVFIDMQTRFNRTLDKNPLIFTNFMKNVPADFLAPIFAYLSPEHREQFSSLLAPFHDYFAFLDNRSSKIRDSKTIVELSRCHFNGINTTPNPVEALRLLINYFCNPYAPKINAHTLSTVTMVKTFSNSEQKKDDECIFLLGVYGIFIKSNETSRFLGTPPQQSMRVLAKKKVNLFNEFMHDMPDKHDAIMASLEEKTRTELVVQAKTRDARLKLQFFEILPATFPAALINMIAQYDNFAGLREIFHDSMRQLETFTQTKTGDFQEINEVISFIKHKKNEFDRLALEHGLIPEKDLSNMLNSIYSFLQNMNSNSDFSRACKAILEEFPMLEKMNIAQEQQRFLL